MECQQNERAKVFLTRLRQFVKYTSSMNKAQNGGNSTTTMSTKGNRVIIVKVVEIEAIKDLIRSRVRGG